MNLHRALSLSLAALTVLAGLYAQRPFREYPGIEYNTFPLPSDYAEKTEWAFARLMYPPSPTRFGGFRGGANWKAGYSIWTQDYPRADRHFSQAIGRLTRLHVRSAEQPVDLDDPNDVYNWPWLYAVQTGQWRLTDSQAAKMREFLLRGGFFMCDDFWGTPQWQVFRDSMDRVMSGRPIVEIPDSDAIFHTVYDLTDRYQVPGARYLSTGVTYKCDNCPAHWRGIYDDNGRLLVAMTYDSDLGDSWEWADDPSCDERFSALGIRIGVNYVVYAMTH